MTQVAMAILRRVDGQYRMVCVGCTMRLIELHMVELIGTQPFNETQPEFVTAFYALVPPHTIADCQIAVADRHVGPAWGE